MKTDACPNCGLINKIFIRPFCVRCHIKMAQEKYAIEAARDVVPMTEAEKKRLEIDYERAYRDLLEVFQMNPAAHQVFRAAYGSPSPTPVRDMLIEMVKAMHASYMDLLGLAIKAKQNEPMPPIIISRDPRVQS